METKVRRIGNSLGIILPKEALEALKVEESKPKEPKGVSPYILPFQSFA